MDLTSRFSAGRWRLKVCRLSLTLLGCMALTAVVSAQVRVAQAPVYVLGGEGFGIGCDHATPQLQDFLEAVSRSSRTAAFKSRTLSGASTFDVSLSGFSSEAEDAFLAAVDIWAGLISSPVTIRVQANFSDLGSGNLLGSAGATLLLTDFSGAQPNTWYPVALANALAGTDLRTSSPDINVTLNSSFSSWYFGLDGNPDDQGVDMISIVLHELGHGLGFADTFSVESGMGDWGFGGSPIIFDRFVKNNLDQQLVNTSIFDRPSTALEQQLTSDNLFFKGIETQSARLYAPSPFRAGSSIAHLDESTYGPGNANSLMTPSISRGEVQHSPGAITERIFRDLGWVVSGSGGGGGGPANQEPEADAGPDQQVTEGEVVLLDGSESFDPDGTDLTYNWVQIAGPSVSFSALAVRPTFSAPQVDVQTNLRFRLTVSDGEESDSDTVNVLVLDSAANQPPVADAGPDQVVDEGQTVTLDGRGSFDPDDDHLIFIWSQIGGPGVSFNSILRRPVFTAPLVQISTLLTFRLTVADGLLSDSDIVEIRVRSVPQNLAPVPLAGPDRTAYEGRPVFLDGSRSFDPDGDPLTFAWRQVTGVPAFLQNTSTARLTFLAPQVEADSTLRFRLSVHDGTVGESQDVLVRVLNKEYSLVFPQFATGQGLMSELSLVSMTKAAQTRARVVWTNGSGASWTLRINDQIVNGESEVLIPPGGLRRLVSQASGVLASGSVQVVSDRPLTGFVLFSGPFGLAGIPAAQETSVGFRAPVEVDPGRSIDTGFAVVNLSDAPANLSVSLLDLDGQLRSQTDSQDSSLSLPGGGQRSFFLGDLDFGQPLDSVELGGIALVTADRPIAATIVQMRENEFATLPVGVEPGQESSPTGEEDSHTLHFAQFAQGEGLFSQIALLNLSTTTGAAATVVVRDTEGADLGVNLEPFGAAPENPTHVAPGGGRVLQTVDHGDVRVGSASVESDQPLSGVIVFGGEFGVAGVPSSRVLPGGFRTPIQIQEGEIDSGVAVMNLEEEIVFLQVGRLDANGNAAGPVFHLELSPLGQTSFFISELDPTVSSFVGLLEVRASGRIAATAIQTRPGQFATVPVADLPRE